MFRLAHLSDPHIGPLPDVGLADLASKRIIGFVNWKRNRRRTHSSAVLAALVEDIAASKPDHLAVTGDLVNLGLSGEFALTGGWLAGLGNGADVTVVPGNHDAYVHGALDELVKAWRPYLMGDGNREVAFPFIRKRGRVAFIGVSSAIPTAPLMATGAVGPDQAAALAAILDELGRAGFFRVILIHHPPASPALHWNRRLIDGGLFREAVREAGAELILHGHNHVSSVTYIAGRDGPVPVVGAAAASRAPRPTRPGGSYWLFEIEAEDGSFACTMIERGVKSGATVVTLAERRLIGGSTQPIGTLTQA